MDVIQHEVRVAFRYPVHFTTGLFGASHPLLRALVGSPPARALFVVDDGVAATHPDLPEAIEGYCRIHHDALALSAPVLIVPGGEPAKNDPRHLARLHEAIHDARLCRHSYVVAVGGGALLDVAGYAAATAHRGVRLIRVPTTVLAQLDSAVGVKNGINAFGQKNYLGTFAPPAAVVNDFDFLETLPDRHWRGGLSEAVKVALIKDAAFFAALEREAPRLARRDRTALEPVVRRSAALHLAHIAGGDPFEQGSSRPLDFGHWSAHRLELLTDHRLSHGEAVAIGIALDSTYAHLAGFLPEADWRRIVHLLAALELPLYAPELDRHLDDPAHPDGVLGGIEEFREHLGGRLTIMLIRAIGAPFDAHAIDRHLVIDAVAMLRSLDHAPSSPEEHHVWPITAEPQGSAR